MNFGVNLYNQFLANAQSLVLMAIGIYLGLKREFAKLIGFWSDRISSAKTKRSANLLKAVKP